MPVYHASEGYPVNPFLKQYLQNIADAITLSHYKHPKILDQTLSIRAWFYTVVDEGIILNDKETRDGMEENIKSIQRIVGKFQGLFNRLEKLAIRCLKRIMADETRIYQYQKIYNFWLTVKQYFLEILNFLKKSLEGILLRVHGGYSQVEARQDVAKVFLSTKQLVQLL